MSNDMFLLKSFKMERELYRNIGERLCSQAVFRRVRKIAKSGF